MGKYRANHTHRDAKGKLHFKPEDEWIYSDVEPIVSQELWAQCSSILSKRKDRPAAGPKPVHLFAGLLYCGCGWKMYVFCRSPKYVCARCRNKIPMEDLEYLFRDELQEFFVSKNKVQSHLLSANDHLTSMRTQLVTHEAKLQKVRGEMRKVYQLYTSDKVSPDGFGRLYKPLEDQERSLAVELPKLQGEVDALESRTLAADDVVAEARSLYQTWPKLGHEAKRKVIESITEKIVVSKDEFHITFCYGASCEELTNRQRNLLGSWRRSA
jgi:site-specific DNA recombinase